jgi:hypothetical protein
MLLSLTGRQGFIRKSVINRRMTGVRPSKVPQRPILIESDQSEHNESTTVWIVILEI